MDLSLKLLEQRIPEIVAAAVRARRTADPVWHCPAPGERAAAAMGSPPPPDDPAWRPLRPGERWGVAPGDDPCFDPPRIAWEVAPTGGSTHWLRVPIQVPAEWRGQEVRLELRWQGEQLDQVESILYLGGAVYTGLDWAHRTAILPTSFHTADGEVLIRCSVAFPRPFGGVELQLHDPTIFRLGQSMATLLGAVKTLAADSTTRHELLDLLTRVYRLLDLSAGYAGQPFSRSTVAALSLLEDGLAELVPAVPGPRAPTLLATGHGHLDVAWLWPLWRTRQKAAHTVATALHLMDRFPEYHFSMSQPQVFAMLKRDDPELYARLRERVLAGRLEPVGMMWVEPDCNLPGGEALIRQLLHGARFWAAEFPERYGPEAEATQVAWLPDVFGFSAALPQILRGCGVQALMTTKLSWNQRNRMPADTFRWRGIDGSEVLAHFLTATEAPVGHPADPQWYSYGGVMTATEVAGSWRHYRQGALNRELLYLYGHGDGGGGPTEEQLLAARVLARVPDLPQVRPGRVDRFFAELLARVWDDPRLPAWSGELYFEYHRGTYTSQAATKAANRRAELCLREAEWLNAWATTLGHPSRQATLDEAWEGVLLNQFHDILPGSSIPLVYQEAQALYAQLLAQGAEVIAATTDTVCATLEGEPAGEGDPQLPGNIALVNALPWERDELVSLPLAAAQALPADTLAQPIEQDGTPLLLVQAQAPAFGFTTRLRRGSHENGKLSVDERTLANAELRLELDEHGEIHALHDLRHDRKLVLPGATLNQLVAYEDRPLAWDAWDIDPFYVEKPTPVRDLLRCAVIEAGPLRAGIELVRRLGASTVTQRILLERGSRRVLFQTTIDWQERQTLLRALFPLNLNPERATSEIQFGALERATHRNTSWEQARFEVAAQRWVDLAEGDYGVALLNDAKYGHSFLGSTIGISLLKSGSFPDAEADRGVHRFCYALLPHAGDWRAARVLRRAYELNAPLRVAALAAPPAAPEGWLLRTPTEHIVVETVKVAHDGDGLIVRLYEAHNQRGPASIVFGRPLQSAEEVDLRERPVGPVAIEGETLRFAVRPFEIKTFRVRLGP